MSGNIDAYSSVNLYRAAFLCCPCQEPKKGPRGDELVCTFISCVSNIYDGWKSVFITSVDQHMFCRNTAPVVQHEPKENKNFTIWTLLRIWPLHTAQGIAVLQYNSFASQPLLCCIILLMQHQ
jgi:hypothetical protein